MRIFWIVYISDRLENFFLVPSGDLVDLVYL